MISVPLRYMSWLRDFEMEPRMESKTIHKASTAIMLMSIFAYMSLVVDLPSYSMDYLRHSKSQISRLMTTLLFPEADVAFSE